MSYVFDNSPLSVLFKNFYPARFPSLWQRFDHLVASGGLLSTREVMHEINDSPIVRMRDWCGQNQGVFPAPTAAEGAFVASIFAVPHSRISRGRSCFEVVATQILL
jgi:uncharacterized protein DUF4411